MCLKEIVNFLQINEVGVYRIGMFKACLNLLLVDRFLTLLLFWRSEEVSVLSLKSIHFFVQRTQVAPNFHL